MYKYASNVTHASDLLIGKFGNNEQGDAELLQIRSPTDAVGVTKITVKVADIAFELISNRIADEKRQDYNWHLQMLKKQYRKILIPELGKTYF